MSRLILALFSLSCLLYVGCGEEQANQKIDATEVLEEDEAHDEISDELFEEAKRIYYSLPSPLEMSTMIRTVGGEYIKTLPLSSKKADEYQSSLKQSMVLGVYGTDLSYSSVYEQKQESLLYLASTKRVAHKMGIVEAFSGNRIERANNNLTNQDSMLTILSEVYWEINSQLKDENRNQMALLVMCSGWVEGLYISTQLMADDTEDNDVVKRLMEQKYTADEMQQMFNDYADDEFLSQAYPYFKSLLDFYSGLEVTKGAEPSAAKQANGKYVIEGDQNVNYTMEDFKTLKRIASESRANIVSI